MHRLAAATHPAVGAVGVAQAVVQFEIRLGALRVGLNRLVQPHQVARVHAAKPISDNLRRFTGSQAQDLVPARRGVQFSARNIPIDHHVVGAFHSQSIAALTVLQTALGAAVAEMIADSRQRHPEVQRLGDVVVGPSFQCFRHRFALSFSGDHDDGKIARGSLLAQNAEHFHAAHLWHGPVEQHQVERSVGYSFQSLLATSGAFYLKPDPLEPPCQHFPAGVVIVNHENVALLIAVGRRGLDAWVHGWTDSTGWVAPAARLWIRRSNSPVLVSALRKTRFTCFSRSISSRSRSLPVTTITGIASQPGWLRALDRNSKPSIRGIMRSSTMQAGTDSRNLFNPSKPSAAARVRTPCLSRAFLIRSLESRSSSTTSTCPVTVGPPAFTASSSLADSAGFVRNATAPRSNALARSSTTVMRTTRLEQSSGSAFSAESTDQPEMSGSKMSRITVSG